MNQRIQELIEQAQDWADAHAPYASEEHEYFAEKFAELIVRECMNVIYNIDDLGGYHFKAVNEVKTHFGVKE